MYFSSHLSKIGINIADKILRKSRDNHSLISLAGGTPPLGISKVYLNEIFRLTAIDQKLSQYSSLIQGSLQLRELIAKDLSLELGKVITNEEILITSGSTAAIFTILQALLNVDDEVILFSPRWSLYKNQCLISRGRIKDVLLDEHNGWSIDFRSLRKAISKYSRAIILADPVNPTGTTFSSQQKKELFELAQKHGLTIIVDETYRHIFDENLEFASIMKNLHSTSNAILCRSFSKDFSMSGYRLGFIYSSKKTIKQLLNIHFAINLMPSTFSQELGRILYSHKEKIIKENAMEYGRRRNLTISKLDQLGDIFSYQKPHGGFFVFPKYVKNINSLDYFSLLFKIGVLVRPGIEFGPGGEKHIRISFATSVYNIEQAFKLIQNNTNLLH